MNSFKDLGISPELVAAVEKLGFVNPTEIQEKAIPALLESDRDFIGLAQTGTGKTAAFGLPLLQLIDTDNKQTQGLIIAPTRELCIQITNDLKDYASTMPNVSMVAVYGGSSIETQIRELKKGVQIIVATPGRLIDLMDRKAAKLEAVDFVVLDEADEMLNMGFQEDIDYILATTKDEKRTWLFSATMPPAVRSIAKKYMEDPFELTVGTKNAVNANIEHVYYPVRARDRYQVVKRLVDFNPDIFGIVFTRTKIEAQEVAEKLIKDGYEADALHGDLSQQQRDKVMGRFRDRSLKLLIATDVAARGIDVDNVTHVIHYSLPDELEVYTHRSGRTARAGKSGQSIAIVHSKELGRIKMLENKIRTKFIKKDIPSGKDICEKQLFNLIHRMHNVEIQDAEIEGYLPKIFEELADLSREDIIKRFASLEFNRFLDYYKNAPDLNGDDRSVSGDDRRGKRGFDRVFVSIGELDDVEKQDMLKFINSLQLGRVEIGRIEIKRSFSFIEIEDSMTEEVIAKINGYEFEGRELRAERAGAPSASEGGGEGRSEGRGGFRGGEGRRGGGDFNRGGYRGGDNNRRGGGDFNRGGRNDRKPSSSRRSF